MFHAHVDPLSQEEIPRQFSEVNSTLRCVISTIAFGMGISIPNIDYIIHWGPPCDVLSYWQEVGRCARDGRQGKALLYTPPYSLDNRRVNQDMLNVLQNDSECKRKKILLTLKVSGISTEDIVHCCNGPNCCSVCTAKNLK